jgi:hypothetical protein
MWGEGMVASFHIQNRLPNKSIGMETPYERWFGHKPDVSMIKVWGCRAYMTDPTYTKALTPKGISLVHTGYQPNVNGYRLVDIKTNKVYIAYHVVFKEHEFPYKDDRLVTSKERQWDTDSDSKEEEQTKKVIETVVPKEKRRSERIAEKNKRALEDQASSGEDAEFTDAEEPEDAALMARHDAFKEFALLSHLGSDSPTYEAAISSKENKSWKVAMQKEIDQLKDMDTFSLVKLPTGRKSIPCKWVLKLKRDENGREIKKKARLTAGGHRQVHGIDYTETFAPVSRIAAIRTLLSLCTRYKWFVHQIDVVGAYLNGTLNEEVYMQQPKGFIVCGKENFVWKLNKSLYGLKQAGREWHTILSEFLQSIGFRRNQKEWGVYMRGSKETLVLIAIYVDDIILCGPNLERIQSVKAEIGHKYSITDEGLLCWYLGIHIRHVNDGIFLSQQRYTEDILERFKFEGLRPRTTPGNEVRALVQKDGQVSEWEAREIASFPYMEVVGCLLYLANSTRPDIATTVNYVARFGKNFRVEHINAVKDILGYLMSTKSYGLLLTGEGDMDVTVYTDADWAGSLEDRKSVSGGTVHVGRSLVAWHSKKQMVVALSSMEAEYISQSHGLQEGIWVHSFINQFMDVNPVIHVYIDNKSAIEISKYSNKHSRAKHIDIRYHFIRDKVEKGEVELHYCPTGEMLADTLTKPLKKKQFQKLRYKLGIRDGAVLQTQSGGVSGISKK